jgi:diguanylate cyclase (GGDEF)-like protein/PAS domain S-box-containing protein
MKILAPLLRIAGTLKVRVAVSVALLFGVVTVLTTAFQLAETRASMVDMLSAQQTTLVTRAAEEIDAKFADREAALAHVAEAIAAHMEQDPGAAHLQLRDRRALNTMFDATFIFSVDGVALAAQPELPELKGLNISQRAYFKESVSTRRPVISAPYRSLASGKPFVMMTAPIFDSNGKLIAVLAGAINLLKPNFLGGIGATPVGRTGYFYVVTRGPQAVVVSHPLQKMILSPVGGGVYGRPGGQALAGFEGTVEGVNSRGVHGLMSYKRLKRTDWVLGAVLPADEAFAPIERLQKKTLAGDGVSLLALAIAVWLIVRRSLRPLDALRRNVRKRLEDPKGATAIEVKRRDEVGELTLDFNRLMAAQRRAERALASNEEKLRTITDNLPVLVGYLDKDLRYRFNNYAYEEWFGLDRATLNGRSCREVLGEADFEKIRPDLETALGGYTVTRERETLINGRARYIQATYLPHYGEGAEVLGIYVLVSDLTDRKAAEDRLDYLAHHDPLTGLYNRGAFNGRLELAIHRMQRNRRACALMYLDVDKFKGINDSHGHGIGDALLREFAARLSGCVRKTDLVGRLGGDEFVVLLEELADPDDTYLVAQKIVDTMREPFLLGEATVHATTSVGLTLCQPGEASITGERLLERADAALYQAKRAGRDTFKVLVKS